MARRDMAVDRASEVAGRDYWEKNSRRRLCRHLCGWQLANSVSAILFAFLISWNWNFCHSIWLLHEHP